MGAMLVFGSRPRVDTELQREPINRMVNAFFDALNQKNVSLALSFSVYKFANSGLYQQVSADLQDELMGLNRGWITLRSIGIVAESHMSTVEMAGCQNAIGGVEALMEVQVEDFRLLHIEMTTEYNGETGEGREAYGCFLIDGLWLLAF